MSQSIDPSTRPLEQVRREERCAQHTTIVRYHMFAAMVIAALGLLMIATGALIPFGIVTICIGVGYAAVAYIVGVIQCRYVDNTLSAPRPEEMDSYAHHPRPGER